MQYSSLAIECTILNETRAARQENKYSLRRFREPIRIPKNENQAPRNKKNFIK